MNLLDVIKRVLSFQDWKEVSALPGWRARPTRKKKDRTPFGGRTRKIEPSRMLIEEFEDKDKRDEYYRELRAKKVFGIAKFSDVRNNRSVWCVARPR